MTSTVKNRWFMSLMFAASLVGAARAQEKKADDEKQLKAAVEQIFKLTNDARAKSNLGALKIDDRLTRAARKHAENMARQGKLQHELDDRKPSDRAKAAGYEYQWLGENIAFSSQLDPAETFERWMKSPGHHANIMKDVGEEIGIGVARDDQGAVYFVQVFAQPQAKK